ncbi:MAG: nucleoside deaminase [Gemmatimonadales bacterium]|nr:nucleoside deaminase [Gemmatimonadales bacterium]
MKPWPESIHIALPAWVGQAVDVDRAYPTEEERVALAVHLASENVRHGTGGPFGAAIFNAATGALVGLGINLVTTRRNCALHAEMVAFMVAQGRVGSHTLHLPGGASHDLATSCEPCAMCLGAVLWSGVRRVLSAATREDAIALGFDEGPVFPESIRYLEAREIQFVRGLHRETARAVMERYVALGGTVYNG